MSIQGRSERRAGAAVDGSKEGVRLHVSAPHEGRTGPLPPRWRACHNRATATAATTPSKSGRLPSTSMSMSAEMREEALPGAKRVGECTACERLGVEGNLLPGAALAGEEGVGARTDHACWRRGCLCWGVGNKNGGRAFNCGRRWSILGFTLFLVISPNPQPNILNLEP